MKLFYIIVLLISFPGFGQNNIFRQARYIVPADYFIAQFSDTSNPSRIYCINKKGKKVWLTNVRDYLLTLELKDSKSKKVELISAKYRDGIIEGTGLTRKNNMITLSFSDVSSIAIQSTYAIESPYFDIDSCKKIWNRKTDSLTEYYSTGKEVVLYLISKNNPKADSLLIYENGCYNINFKDNVHIKKGVVQKITTDSIYVSNNFDTNSAKVNNDQYKVLKYSISDIAELQLLKTGGYSYKNMTINNYNIVPLEIERNKLIPPCWFKINSYSGKVELYRALLTLSGFVGVKEENGKLYWYE